jgi:hypothetical protein
MKPRRRKTLGAVCTAIAATALTTLGLAGSASASSELYEKFDLCPIEKEGVARCLYAVTEGGKVTLGNKTVSIVNDVTLQGGYGAPVEEEGGEFSTLIPPTNGVTLSKTPQPVPGGLAGLVNCPEISNFILRAACEWTFENGLTGVNSVLELAGTLKLSETNLTLKQGVAMRMPIKVKLENPFLGSNCYIGSDKAPIIWNLTAGTTTPPEGVEPITGETGSAELLDGGRILKLSENKLVENNWAAPGTSGCGGIFSFLLDPIVSAASGLPAAAGKNVAILENTVHIGSANAVKKDRALNP